MALNKVKNIAVANTPEFKDQEKFLDYHHFEKELSQFYRDYYTPTEKHFDHRGLEKSQYTLER